MESGSNSHAHALQAAGRLEAVLSPAELVTLTGYRRGAEQLAELHRRGFHRAYRNRAGKVVLERPHYLAVSAQSMATTGASTTGPNWSKVA